MYAASKLSAKSRHRARAGLCLALTLNGSSSPARANGTSDALPFLRLLSAPVCDVGQTARDCAFDFAHRDLDAQGLGLNLDAADAFATPFEEDTDAVQIRRFVGVYHLARLSVRKGGLGQDAGDARSLAAKLAPRPTVEAANYLEVMAFATRAWPHQGLGYDARAAAGLADEVALRSADWWEQFRAAANWARAPVNVRGGGARSGVEAVAVARRAVGLDLERIATHFAFAVAPFDQRANGLGLERGDAMEWALRTGARGHVGLELSRVALNEAVKQLHLSRNEAQKFVERKTAGNLNGGVRVGADREAKL